MYVWYVFRENKQKIFHCCHVRYGTLPEVYIVMLYAYSYETQCKFRSDHDDNNDDKHTSYKIHFNFQRRTLHVPLNFLSLFVFCFLFNSFFMFNFSYFKSITHCTVFLFFYLHRHHLMQQLYLLFAKRNNTAKNACHAIRCDTMTMPYHTTTTTRALMCVLVYNYKTLITFFTKLIITKTFYGSKTNSKSFDSAALVVAYTTIKYN